MLRPNPKLLAQYETSVIQQFEGYVVNLAAKRKYDPDWTEHLIQSCLILVWKAYNKWNPERAGFYTWITYYVNILLNRAFFEDIVAPREENVSWDFNIEDDNQLLHMEDSEVNTFKVKDLKLCERDSKVAAMLTEGYTKKEIKIKLNISSDTLKLALDNIRSNYLQYKNTEHNKK
jgi:hypothetical protein